MAYQDIPNTRLVSVGLGYSTPRRVEWGVFSLMLHLVFRPVTYQVSNQILAKCMLGDECG